MARLTAEGPAQAGITADDPIRGYPGDPWLIGWWIGKHGRVPLLGERWRHFAVPLSCVGRAMSFSARSAISAVNAGCLDVHGVPYGEEGTEE
jgi:hypothetical protein